MKDLMYEIRNTKGILNGSLDRAKKTINERNILVVQNMSTNFPHSLQKVIPNSLPLECRPYLMLESNKKKKNRSYGV